MAQVRELFSELFAYVLLFEQTTLQEEFQPSYEHVRRDIATLLEQQKVAATRQGMSQQEYQDASFAVVAWADETILKHSSWQHHSQWNTFPLQLEYYNTRNAGEEFFDRLERLRTEQKEVREVYYLCLGLGFSGRYFLGLEDELKLNQIRHEQARHLPLPPEEVQDIDKITSQPYEVVPPGGRPITRPWTHVLLKAGLGVLVVVPLLLYVTYKLWEPPSPTKPAPLAPPATLTAEDIQRQLGVQQCANIAIGLQAGVVDLAGRVGSETQRADIRRVVQNIQGVTQVKDSFQIIPRPFCDVLELLEPIKKRGQDQGFGLIANLNKQGSPALYVNDENLVIDVKTPRKFESYMYVDYYTTDGMVGHLFPNPVERLHVFSPEASYTIGKMGDPQRLAWKIQAPFGLELVTIIASKTPLFLTPRYDPEPADAYITMLRQALTPDVAKSEVDATFSFIRTRGDR